jgi:hypothetical protein
MVPVERREATLNRLLPFRFVGVGLKTAKDFITITNAARYGECLHVHFSQHAKDTHMLEMGHMHAYMHTCILIHHFLSSESIRLT